MKSPLHKNAMRTTVFGDLMYMDLIRAGMSMWSIFDQLEMHMKKVTITSQWKCYMKLKGVSGIDHAPYLSQKFHVLAN